REPRAGGKEQHLLPCRRRGGEGLAGEQRPGDGSERARPAHDVDHGPPQRICSTTGSVEDRGSSFTGRNVMSRKRAKYTSSSTTPSWLWRLEPRSSPFAPPAVPSSSDPMILAPSSAVPAWPIAPPGTLPKSEPDAAS